MERILVIYILLSIILFIAGITVKDDNIFSGICMGIVIGLTVSLVTAFAIFSTTPSAMDVYQGKTTLEITYKDSIAVDSTVVFKNNLISGE